MSESFPNCHFTIWAPAARTVELCVGDTRHPMTRSLQGRWEVTLPNEARATEVRYRYSVNGADPLPDPFSRWQPDGPHGDSCWLAELATPAALSTFKAKPLAEAVIYELHIGTFTVEGTYRAAREKLPHLVALGVTHVEVLPLATFPGHHGWGYDGVSLFAPHPAYGTPAELREFIAACHDHGLAVLLDVVYNHFGPDGNYLPVYGPCFLPHDTLWGRALNYDGPGSDGMRQLVLDNATLWLRDYGFDGLRLDAVHAILDTSATHLLEELATHVRRLGAEMKRPLVLIAESDLNDPRLVRPVSAGGYGLDAFWADDFHHAAHRLFTGESHRYYADFDGLRDVATALRDGYVYQGQYQPSRDRRHGRAPVGLHPEQFVFCLQNHDQVGNRAWGERLSQLLNETQLKSAAALLLLAPQVPMLFQGEEWGARTPFLYFTDHRDPQLAAAVSKGRRAEFAAEGDLPDPQDPETFRRSQLRWEEIDQPAHAALLDWHRRLLALRRELGFAACTVEHDEDKRWLVMNRGDLLAVFNFSDLPQNVPLPAGEWRVELAAVEGDGATHVSPGGVVVLAR